MSRAVVFRGLPVTSLGVCLRYTGLKPLRCQKFSSGSVSPNEAPSQCTDSGLRSAKLTRRGGRPFLRASCSLCNSSAPAQDDASALVHAVARPRIQAMPSTQKYAAIGRDNDVCRSANLQPPCCRNWAQHLPAGLPGEARQLLQETPSHPAAPGKSVQGARLLCSHSLPLAGLDAWQSAQRARLTGRGSLDLAAAAPLSRV